MKEKKIKIKRSLIKIKTKQSIVTEKCKFEGMLLLKNNMHVENIFLSDRLCYY